MTKLYPLPFEPIFQYRPWGGRALQDLFGADLPEGLVGEAWVLSDRPGQQSVVASGDLSGRTLRELIEEFPEQIMGRGHHASDRFPLLMKFLDARDVLSVQVHPSDRHVSFLPAGEMGKSEAWVVVKREPGSRIYAGLRPDTTPDSLRQAVIDGTVADQLAFFHPEPGDTVFVAAGTVHALGAGLVVFEAQQNSDITFRLYDWDRPDSLTGQLRDLQVDEATACIDFARGQVLPVAPEALHGRSDPRQLLIDSEIFRMWRNISSSDFGVGIEGEPRVIVSIEGTGQLESGGQQTSVGAGDVILIPASVGHCRFVPDGEVNVLELALPV
jgi:mannose-6-phosphate isomerase